MAAKMSGELLAVSKPEFALLCIVSLSVGTKAVAPGCNEMPPEKV